ncbi:type II secretion system F family protein [Ideonella sp.]|uniref:type II secretion system F family protein n=1 Tax=Ideonella sp. TaxID=1929293 RepID=UPI002B474FFA|nr:type II secretion system F family protein [Ideonella sp.]HJV70298.1 type II secretion system F family protein [Ideonella sp.]
MKGELALVAAMIFGAVFAAVWAMRAAYLRWRANFTEQAKLSLEDMFVFVDPRSVFRGTLLAFLLLPMLAWFVTGTPFFAVMAAIAGGVVPRAAWGVLRRRRLAKLVAQLPDGLTMMGGSLRAGASLQQALDMVVQESPAPLSQEFSLLLREQRLGLALEDSLHGMAERLGAEEIHLFVSALSIAKEVGGNLSEILDRLASTLLAKAAMEGKIKALTSQGKLQGIIVGMLPLFLAGILYVMDPDAMMPLFTTLYGWGVMAGVFVMLLLGGFFIRKIVTIDV